SEADATLTVLDCAFIGNQVTGSSPGVLPLRLHAFGGGIDNEGRATVQDSSFTDNQALGGSGMPGMPGGSAAGGGIYNGMVQVGQGLRAILTVSHSTFTDNQALGRSGMSGDGGFAVGGGIANHGGATLVISQSTLTGNQAVCGAGGAGGRGPNGSGGAIDNVRGAHLTVSHCMIADNQVKGGDA